jgi:hypothetical protein
LAALGSLDFAIEMSARLTMPAVFLADAQLIQSGLDLPPDH